jgi:hypothetical protein
MNRPLLDAIVDIEALFVIEAQFHGGAGLTEPGSLAGDSVSALTKSPILDLWTQILLYGDECRTAVTHNFRRTGTRLKIVRDDRHDEGEPAQINQEA